MRTSPATDSTCKALQGMHYAPDSTCRECTLCTRQHLQGPGRRRRSSGPGAADHYEEAIGAAGQRAVLTRCRRLARRVRGCPQERRRPALALALTLAPALPPTLCLALSLRRALRRRHRLALRLGVAAAAAAAAAAPRAAPRRATRAEAIRAEAEEVIRDAGSRPATEEPQASARVDSERGARAGLARHSIVHYMVHCTVRCMVHCMVHGMAHYKVRCTVRCMVQCMVRCMMRCVVHCKVRCMVRCVVHCMVHCMVRCMLQCMVRCIVMGGGWWVAGGGW